MDEEFHHPQTAELCDALAHARAPRYHDKITTPPGLYVVSLVATLGAACWSLAAARAVSAASLAGVAAAVASLVEVRREQELELEARQRHREQPHAEQPHAEQEHHERLTHTPLLVTTFPPLLFISGLYYTDAVSLLALLWGWRAAASSARLSAAALLLISLTLRQSNVVWVAFIAGSVALRRLRQDLPRTLQDYVSAVLTHRRELALDLLLPCALILSLLGSDLGALGDKEHHRISLHLAQICYLSVALFAGTGIAAAVALSPREWLAAAANLAPLPAVLALLASLAEFARSYTITHPFLLADNRHYTFYLWSRVIRRHEHGRLALVPGYWLSALGVLCACSRAVRARTTSKLELLGFSVCAAASVVPLPLVEPRYFFPAVAVFTVLVAGAVPPRAAWATVHLNSAVFVGLAFVFLFRPFSREDGIVGRFMP